MRTASVPRQAVSAARGAKRIQHPAHKPARSKEPDPSPIVHWLSSLRDPDSESGLAIGPFRVACVPGLSPLPFPPLREIRAIRAKPFAFAFSHELGNQGQTTLSARKPAGPCLLHSPAPQVFSLRFRLHDSARAHNSTPIPALPNPRIPRHPRFKILAPFQAWSRLVKPSQT